MVKRKTVRTVTKVLNPSLVVKDVESLEQQYVGLEAAIIQRVRNSSLIQVVLRRKIHEAQAWYWLLVLQPVRRPWGGRGASCSQRRSTVRTAGAYRSANVGMSSAMWVRNPHAGSLDRRGRLVRSGLVGPKPRTKVVGDGHPVDIPEPPEIVCTARCRLAEAIRS